MLYFFSRFFPFYLHQTLSREDSFQVTAHGWRKATKLSFGDRGENGGMAVVALLGVWGNEIMIPCGQWK